MEKVYNFEHPVHQEPIVKNRYVVRFLDKNINIPSYFVQKISLPKFSNGEWEEMSMELLNIIDCSTIIELNKILNKLDAQYKIDIEILDPVGQITGTWHLSCMITAIDFGDFDYGFKGDSTELLISKIKFKILNCKFVV
jgi:hypothetical protein